MSGQVWIDKFKMTLADVVNKEQLRSKKKYLVRFREGKKGCVSKIFELKYITVALSTICDICAGHSIQCINQDIEIFIFILT